MHPEPGPGCRDAMDQHAIVPRRRSGRLATGLVLVLGLVNTAALAGFGYTGHLLLERLRVRERDNARLQARADEAEARSMAVRREAQAGLKDIEQVTEERLRFVEAAMSRARAEDVRTSLESSNTLVRALADREEVARQEVMVALQADIRSLDDRLRRRMTEPQRSTEDGFRQIQVEADASIFLVHCEFSYRTKAEGSTLSEQLGTGWGTAFVLSPEGHLVTNKHVVQPWKFDPELAAMEALGQVEILQDSVRISAWPAGTRCLDADHNLLPDTGYSNGLRNNLRVVALAPDHMVKKPIEVAGNGVEFSIHELDNNDLAILKVDGGNFKPLACAPVGHGQNLHKLDRIMALGFPRGHRGLEAGIAETSATLGTVRKVEETIHITASIIPGNSGGPVFNQDGRVVGVATRIYSETLGICLKIDHALALLETVWKAPAETAADPTGSPPAPAAPSTVAEHR